MVTIVFNGNGGAAKTNGSGDAVREAALRFCENVKVFALAESLGGVESLVCHPASMTHAPMCNAVLAEAGIGQNLIRLSIGLESVDDLIADILRALEAAEQAVLLQSVELADNAVAHFGRR